MNRIQEMIALHPLTIANDAKRIALAKCVQECFDCAQTCQICSDACLGEEMVGNLRGVIRATADCASICINTGNVLLKITEPDINVIKSQVNACITSVKQCGKLCNDQMHKHCKVCAEACRDCEISCNEYLKLFF